MSERIVNDPSQHGWVEVDGKWMWGSSGGSGGGSIQDGDTEGQITTWDGTEWTPSSQLTFKDSGSVVAKLENTASEYSLLQFANNNQTGSVTSIGSQGDDFRIALLGAERLRIDADGNVNITGKLFVNGQEVTAGGGGGGFWVEESPGVIKYNGTAKATDLVATG